MEDRALYPALQRSGNASLARMGRQYQRDIKATWALIASAYDAFARRWNTAESLRTDEKGFRAEANVVLRKVYERMQREDRDFYPASRSKGRARLTAPRRAHCCRQACRAGFLPCLPVRLCWIKLPIVFDGYRGHHR